MSCVFFLCFWSVVRGFDPFLFLGKVCASLISYARHHALSTFSADRPDIIESITCHASIIHRTALNHPELVKRL